MNVRNDLPPLQPIAADPQVFAIEKGAGNGASPVGSAPATRGTDQAHLSFAASLIGHAASLSDVRADKVQSVNGAIADGSYNVDATDVAQSLMNHMLGSQK
jgi:flagellar biosynthesis anti-sigma factor FlgM